MPIRDPDSPRENYVRTPAAGVTQLLLEWSGGSDAALERLLPLVHESLNAIARKHLRNERPNHTLEPNALVNEVYLRLVDQKQVSWRDRAHFFGAAAQIMRRILVDHARKRNAEKRGGSISIVPLDESILAAQDEGPDVLLLDEALSQLAKIYPQQSSIVEMRFFAGLTIEETAEALNISMSSVNREWTMAKAWLHRAMQRKSVGAGR